MRSCANCNNQLRYAIYTQETGYTNKEYCRYGLPQGQVDCKRYELDLTRIPTTTTKPGMIELPKTLVRDIYEALVSSRKVREEYKCGGEDWVETLYTDLMKYLPKGIR